MARPRKPPSEHRKRWDALYVTADERAGIAAAAKAAGRSVSRYLVAAHQNARPQPAHGTAALLQALARSEDQLAAIAHAIAERGAPIDAVMLQADLLAVERGFRRAVLPWAVSIDNEREGDPSC